MNYVLITPNISGIGGAQQYTLRKLRFLSQNGIRVVIVTGNDKDILLEELLNYPRRVIPEVSFPLHMVSKKKAMLISTDLIDTLRKEFGSDERLLFDSATVGCGTWGDYIAGRVNSSSFTYDVNGLPIRDGALASFASSKFSRGELLGCSKYSNQKLFANFPEYYDESKNLYVNVPFDNSEIVDDTKGTEFSKDPNTLRILTVSRIEKRYLAYLIGEVSKVAQIIPDKTIELTMVLSRRHGKEFDLLKKQSLDIPKNMKVSFLGPIVPLTKSLFLTHDIFVGVGTASLNAISLGVPTIVADFNSDKSIGILGIDAEDFGYAPIKDITISQQIQRFLDNPTLFMEASERGLSLFQEEYESSAVMTKFMEHVERIMKQEPEYYSFDKISLSGREKLKKAVMSIAGVKGYDFLVKLYAKRRGYSE
jgi:glycosyltransferase involved in cell wall biosynthesis